MLDHLNFYEAITNILNLIFVLSVPGRQITGTCNIIKVNKCTNQGNNNTHVPNLSLESAGIIISF